MKADHHNTMRVSTRRGPMRSPIVPVGNLEQAVGQREHRRRPSPSRWVDAQLLLHAGAGDRDADAIDVGDGEEEDEESENAVAESHVAAILS